MTLIRDNGYRIDAAIDSVSYHSKKGCYRDVRRLFWTTPALLRQRGGQALSAP
jgi:hypothetical protein